MHCGYSSEPPRRGGSEPPRRGGSNVYQQSMFWAKIKKNIKNFLMYCPRHLWFVWCSPDGYSDEKKLFSCFSHASRASCFILCFYFIKGHLWRFSTRNCAIWSIPPPGGIASNTVYCLQRTKLLYVISCCLFLLSLVELSCLSSLVSVLYLG